MRQKKLRELAKEIKEKMQEGYGVIIIKGERFKRNENAGKKEFRIKRREVKSKR